MSEWEKFKRQKGLAALGIIAVRVAGLFIFLSFFLKLYLRQSLFEIVYQVVCVFNTY